MIHSRGRSGRFGAGGRWGAAPGGPALDAWDDPAPHPDAYLSVNAEYADIAALVAAYTPIFTDYVETDTGVVDDSILYHGYKSVRIDMSGFNGWLEADVTVNPEPSAELICKRIVRFDDVTGGSVDLGQAGNYLNLNGGGIVYGIAAGRFQSLGTGNTTEGQGVYTPAASPAGSFFSIVQRCRITASGAPVNSATWIGGVKRMDVNRDVNAGAATFNSLLGQYFGAGGSMAGAGASMRYVMFEYIDGIAHPDPYGLPGW